MGDRVQERMAVLVGAGAAHGAPRFPSGRVTSPPVHQALRGAGRGGDAPEPVDLMVDAALAALSDAIGQGERDGEGECDDGDCVEDAAARIAKLASCIGMVAVPEGNWSYADPGRLVADRIGATAARTVRVDIGVPQCTPVRIAFERIQSGELDAALIVGGEAKATQLRIARAGGAPPETDQGDARPDERWVPEGELMAEPEITAGIWDPVAQYACIENALRHAEGVSIDEHLDQIAALWERFDRVAAANPFAAFGEGRDAAYLRVAGPGNRPLAFPYAKWHSTQWAVDQGAALLLCSTALADELRVETSRRVFPRVLVESSHSVSMSRREELWRWPAMAELGTAAERHLGRSLREVEHVELYSCFPAAVRVQQRELGLPLDGTPTITGGMPFAGGPFNNFTYQATVAMVDALRRDPGSLGLVSTVSGLLTKPGLAAWSTEPDPRGPLLADLAAEATAATGVCEVSGEHRGTGRVVTYTVTWAGEQPSSAFVVGELDDGRRWVGVSTDPELLRRGIEGPELIGCAVSIDGSECRFASV